MKLTIEITRLRLCRVEFHERICCSLDCEDNMDDIQTLLYNLREDVCCPICSDTFTDPKQLTCLHSFCLQCLKQWHQTSQTTVGRQDSVICPTCRGPSTVPANGDLKDLPTSFYLNGLIDVLAIKECNNTQVTCGNCDKKSSEASYCFQCCIFYCLECTTSHNKMRSNKDHRALALKEFQDKDFEDVLKRPAFCPKQRHQNEELKYFCKTCETAVCQTCSSLEHSGHALEHVEDEAKRQKNEIKTMMKSQRQNLQAKKGIVSQLDESEATERSKLEDEIKVIEALLEKADKLLTRGTNAEIIQLKKSLATISKQVVQTKPITLDLVDIPPLVLQVQNGKTSDTINSEKIRSIERRHQTKASQSIVEGRGLNKAFAGHEAQFTLTTRNARGRQCYDKYDIVIVEILDKREGKCATEARINDNNNGIYNITYSPNVQGRCSITVKVNGEHICGSLLLCS